MFLIQAPLCWVSEDFGLVQVFVFGTVECVGSAKSDKSIISPVLFLFPLYSA